jgi:hypothetical protein
VTRINQNLFVGPATKPAIAKATARKNQSVNLAALDHANFDVLA